jgi:hypothetical protein
MNNFQQFDIKVEAKSFEGDKIKIERVMNKQIVVEAFKIVESKYKEKGNGKCLHIQIIVDNAKRVLFTGSGTLQEMIEKVPANGFPFITTIIKENDRYRFT